MPSIESIQPFQNGLVRNQFPDGSLVDRFRSLISNHFETLLPALVKEYEKDISTLQADNQRLRQLLTVESDVDAGSSTRREPGKKTGTVISIDDYWRPLPSAPAVCNRMNLKPDDVAIQAVDDGIPDAQATNNAVQATVVTEQSKPEGPGNDAEEEAFINEEDISKKGAYIDHTSKPGAERVLFLHTGKGVANKDSHPLHEQREVSTKFPYPEETWTRLQRLVFSNTFELISGFIILANTAVMALQLQYAGFDNGAILKSSLYKPAKDTWPGAETSFEILEVVFNAIFVVELSLRTAAFRWRAVCSGWIWFDVVVISLSCVDLIFGEGFVDPGMTRTIRLVRLVRLLKVFHAMKGFDSLFLLIKAVQASVHAAVWSFLVVGMVQLIIGLFLCQHMRDILNDESIDIESRRAVFIYFGTFSRSMFTMFEITFGAWHVSCRILMENVSEWFSLFYIVYRCTFLFAVLKVIAAVFITETNRVLEHDDELNIIKANRDLALFSAKFNKIISRIDQNKDGLLNWDELGKLMRDESLTSMLPMIGFDKNDLLKLFWLIEDGTGEVSVNEFFVKLCKLKGPAKKINEMATLKLVYTIQQLLEKAFRQQGVLEQTVTSESMNRAVNM